MPSLRTIVAGATIALIQTTQAWHIELPVCLDPYQPYVYAGCFKDGRPGIPGNGLIYRSGQNQQDMTVEKCVSECKGNGFRYAGLKYWGACFCGSTVNGAQLEESECTYPCSGDKTQTCGGDSQFSVWQDPTFKVNVGRLIEDFKPLGCYTDNSDKGRALSWSLGDLDNSKMTPSLCLSNCADKGFPFSGVEYGSECWCGMVMANDTAKVDTSECNMNCNGDSNSKCGGTNRINLYVANDLLSLQPCGWKPNAVSSSSTVITSSTVISSSTGISSSTVVSSSSSSSTSSSSSVSSASSTSVTSTLISTTATSSSASSTNINPNGITTTTTTNFNPDSVTTTGSAALCTTTAVVPNQCEYKCGNWCAPSIPDFQDEDNCVNAYKTCAKLTTSCFKSAGWPGVLDCFDFSKWCDNIQGFCSSTCTRGRRCNKKDCLDKYRPLGSAPKTTTSVFPCAATTTSTIPSSAVTSVAPEPTNICKQPTSYWYGYGPGNPVGKVELPLVSCNDLKDEFSSRPFKLYDSVNSRQCKSYQRSQTPNACAEACKAQYDDCVDVYVESCKRLSGKNYFARRSLERSGIDRRWFNFFTEGWSTANTKCKVQYSDCLIENRNVDINARCNKWGSGY